MTKIDFMIMTFRYRKKAGLRLTFSLSVWYGGVKTIEIRLTEGHLFYET